MKQTVGRPTKITKDTLGLLKEAFLMGCTDEEACLYAEINPDTLYEYQKKNSQYSEKKELWKQEPFLLARRSIISGLKEDPELALKYMERKKRDEFSLAQKIDITSSEKQIVEFTYIVPKERAKEFLEEHGMKNVKTQ